jgi:hypothetical protein
MFYLKIFDFLSACANSNKLYKPYCVIFTYNVVKLLPRYTATVH